ncbi:hypothetical protein JT26_06010 [Porphyromonas sp. COT-108 OH1349]|nr:hypothetical protein JT26_06010 [Porphyromonas sp. COT-108 OH1349]
MLLSLSILDLNRLKKIKQGLISENREPTATNQALKCTNKDLIYNSVHVQSVFLQRSAHFMNGFRLFYILDKKKSILLFRIFAARKEEKRRLSCQKCIKMLLFNFPFTTFVPRNRPPHL